MRIESLEAFGLPAQLLRLWEKQHGPELLPAQEAAVVQTDLLRGGSLVLFAPTGAGKTLVGEMAALRAATQGRRTLYLVPTKALAEEKYALLRGQYAGLGLRVAISTRDRRQDDARLLRGEFDLAVTVPEKAHYLLGVSPGMARALGCVVADELQLLADPQRGPALEVTLAQLRAACPELQVVGLSAVLDEPGLVAEWLGAQWLQVRRRPVELRQGALAEGVFRYREYNTGEQGEEPWRLDLAGLDWEEAAAALALWLAAAGEPTLIFVPDRRSAVGLALRLAEDSRLNPASEVLAQLEALPRTAARERLRELAAGGVAFHSSDLQFEERRVIEEGFARGELRLLCSTATLALGVNLPARNVLLAPERWDQSAAGGPPVRLPLSSAEFENMGGRAGRPGYGEAFGRAILLADSRFEQEALLGRYTQREYEPLEPALGRLSPLSQLTLLCSGEGEDQEAPLRLYRHTLTAYTRGEDQAAQLPPVLEAALQSAVRYELLTPGEPEGRLRITPLGRLAATSGASLEGFYWLARELKSLPAPPGELGLLYLAATTPEARALAFPLSAAAAREQDWPAALEAEAAAEDQPLLEHLRASRDLSAYDKARAAKLGLALRRRATAEPTDQVEAAVQVSAGRLETAAETVAWLLHLAAEIGTQLGWSAAWGPAVEAAAQRLGVGLPAELLPLHQELRGAVGRDRVLALAAAGVGSPADLQALPLPQRRKLLPEGQWRDVPELARRPSRPASPVRAPSPAAELTAAPQLARPEEEPPLVLVVDPARPDRVLFHGREVPLRPTEWKLLATLAAQPGRCVPYRTLYLALWGPDEMVEPGQVHWHRSRLLERLRAALPAGEAPPVRTLARRGYLLDLSPDEVRCPSVEELRREECGSAA